MWNSSQCEDRGGKRYRVDDIAALTYPLDVVIDSLEFLPVKDVVNEGILSRMEKDELTYAVYQLLQALLEDLPIPAGGHPGFQEAIIAELLQQTHELVTDELADPDRGDFARQAAWTSFTRLCGEMDDSGNKCYWQLEGLRLDLKSPHAHRSNKLTPDHWHEMILGDGGIWSEFLWDEDWRMDGLMDQPEAATKRVREWTGIDLDVVQQLPHAPTPAELAMAVNYVRHVIAQR